MKINRPSVDEGIALPSSGGLVQAWSNFWFSPVVPVGLHHLRFLAGVLFLAWLLPLAGHLDAFFGREGLFDRQAYSQANQKLREFRENPDMNRMIDFPPVNFGWSFLYLFGSGTSLTLAYWVSIGILAAFTLGIFPRLTALLTWIVVVSFLASPGTNFDADFLLPVLAFYIMIGYLLKGIWSWGHSWREELFGPLVTWFWGSEEERSPVPSHAANLAIRLFQVHFAIIVVMSGLHKLQMADWWAGVALWYPIYSTFEATPEKIASLRPMAREYLFFLTLIQYIVLAWQLAFPLFAWKRRLPFRVLLVGGGIMGWMGSFFIFGQPIFGPFYLIGCLSFLTAAEWSWLGGGFSRSEMVSRPVLATARPKSAVTGENIKPAL